LLSAWMLLSVTLALRTFDTETLTQYSRSCACGNVATVV
jgi:hypothetical protein